MYSFRDHSPDEASGTEDKHFHIVSKSSDKWSRQRYQDVDVELWELWIVCGGEKPDFI